MVKESVDKVSLASLHSRRGGVLRRYFLGENKNDRGKSWAARPPSGVIASWGYWPMSPPSLGVQTCQAHLYG
jgi:hypothetical protein